MKKFSFVRYVIPLCLLFICSGWGFLAHRTVNQLAIYQLPAAMRPFFYENKDYLVRHSVRPDQRRNSDATEAPKHFIDFEAYGDSAAWKMPRRWVEAVNKYSNDTLKEYGFVPYWLMEMKDKLTNAFRVQNGDSILFYAADLAHYIGDANVPLHTSINYDGQLTGQRGLHSLWETTVPELELNAYNLYNGDKATYLRNPEETIWNTVQEAHRLLPDVFGKETEATRDFTDSTKYRKQMRNGREIKNYSSAFAKAYGQRLGNTVNGQLLRSADLIADIWYTCWIDAGKPDLARLLKKMQTKDDKKKVRGEWKAYRKNELIKKNYLIARQPNADSD